MRIWTAEIWTFLLAASMRMTEDEDLDGFDLTFSSCCFD